MSKVLFVIGRTKMGGAEKRARLIAALLKEEFDTKVFAFSGEKEVDIDFVFRNSYKEYKKESFKKRIAYLRSILEQEKPDVVISFVPHINFFTSIALKARKFRNIKHIIGIVYPFYRVKERVMLWYSIKHASAVYYQSEEQKEYIKCKCYSFALSNPIKPFTSFSNKDKYHFMSVGRLETQKDFAFQIDVMSHLSKLLPSITLDIYGSGSLKSELENKIVELGLSSNVKIHDYIDNIQEEFNRHDIFLFTTKSEGFPNALAEAMMAGLIVFSTPFKTGCADLLIEEKTGYLFEKKYPKAFADFIYEKLLSYEVALDIAKHGQEHVSNVCNIESFKHRMTSEFKKILAK